MYFNEEKTFKRQLFRSNYAFSLLLCKMGFCHFTMAVHEFTFNIIIALHTDLSIKPNYKTSAGI